MIEDLAPSGYMRYSPDGHFVVASFASAFLLKLLRPELVNLLGREGENEIFDLIGRLIQTLSGNPIAIDDRHAPKLYARFLAGLLSKHRRDGTGAIVGRLQTQPPPSQSMQMPPHNQGSEYSHSQSTFSVNQSSSSSSSSMQGGYNYTSSQAQSTPVYRPEATFSGGAGSISFGSSDLDILNLASSTQLGNGGNWEDEILATMAAIKNPDWWQNMMMPGFSWSDPGSPESNISSSTGHSHPSGYQSRTQATGLTTGAGLDHGGTYGMFHAMPQQVPLSLI